MEQRKPLVKLVDIKKEFPGVKALKGVSLEILPGEVHGLVGENGAGKSTLIKIMMGAYTATSGEIFVDGVRQDIRNPQQARALGLGAVYQDVTLAAFNSCGKLFPGLPTAKKRTSGLENHVSERTKNA
mgnify:CR=1 FL=1